MSPHEGHISPDTQHRKVQGFRKAACVFARPLALVTKLLENAFPVPAACLSLSSRLCTGTSQGGRTGGSFVPVVWQRDYAPPSFQLVCLPWELLLVPAPMGLLICRSCVAAFVSDISPE